MHLYSHNMICIKLGHLLIVWLGLGCVCSCFLTHLECMLSVVVLQTIRVYAHTYNMTPSVSSVSSYQT